MMTNPLSLYSLYHCVMCGNVRMQLMQEYVQKSSRTTLPLSCARVSGCEFIQSVMPVNSGAIRLSPIFIAFQLGFPLDLLSILSSLCNKGAFSMEMLGK